MDNQMDDVNATKQTEKKQSKKSSSSGMRGKLSINKAILLQFAPVFFSVFALIVVLVANITSINVTKDDVSRYNTEIDTVYAAGMAHYNWTIQLLEHINNGSEFNGTLDYTACDFGKLILSDPSGKSDTLINFSSTANTYHQALHMAGSEITSFDFTSTMSADDIAAMANLNSTGELTDEMVTDIATYERSLKTAIYNEKAAPNLAQLATLIYTAIDNIEVSITDAESDLEGVILRAYLMCGIVSIFVIITILKTLNYIRKQIVAPITFLREGSLALSEGDLSASFYYDSKTEELSLLSIEIQNSVDNIKDIILDIEDCVGSLSNKDFSIYPQMKYIGDFKAIEQSIGELIVAIRDTMSEMSSASSQVNIGADHMSSAAQALARGTIEQTSSVDILYDIVKDVTEKVKETADNANEADSLGQVAVQVVEKSTYEMEQLMTAIGEIQESSAHIEKIIKTIDDIAFQTNILALNAAVEAARAGQAGRGFAVVADEVRNLAQKSAEAAQSTTALIGTSLQAVERGTTLANSTNETFEEVAKNTEQVLSFVGEIARATREQLTSIDEISNSVGEISAVVQTNSATSEESAAASEELSSQSATMNSLISEFKLGQ
ncbi:MAG: methyl-accepting chemotaxis protein [Bacillota bacterium]